LVKALPGWQRFLWKTEKIAAFGSSYREAHHPMQELPKAAIF